MKAISIRPIWAHCILHYGKRIENRTWAPTYRGPLLIHAGKGMTKAEYDLLCGMAEEDRHPIPKRHEILNGGIVGRCEIVGVVSKSRDPWFGGPLGWKLEQVEPVPFVPYRGQLSLFEVPWPKPEALRGYEHVAQAG